MSLTLKDIVKLLDERGASRYGGERVSQLEHALQCAALAEASGEPDTIVVAALLHDLGHLLAPPAPGERDDVHQYVAMPFLRGLFPEEVLAPIRLHVDAKRWLCATERAYHDRLSEPSRRSLALQGGPFAPHEAEAFIAHPHAPAAVRLRRYDDGAKTPGRATPPLDRYVARMQRCVV